MDVVDFGNAQSRAADSTSRVQQLLTRGLKGCDHLGRRQEDSADVYEHWQAVSKPNVGSCCSVTHKEDSEAASGSWRRLL